MKVHPPHRGDVISGVGHSEYIPVGVCPGTYRGGGGGLRCGQSPKKGVLGAGTTKKGGCLRNVHSPKKWVIRNLSCTKRRY